MEVDELLPYLSTPTVDYTTRRNSIFFNNRGEKTADYTSRAKKEDRCKGLLKVFIEK